MGEQRTSLREGMADRVRPLLAAGWRGGLRLAARDETEAAGPRSCLVVVPHPDDETLSSGALIARKRAQDTPVEVIVLTDGSASTESAAITPQEMAALRRAELDAACERLGVAPTQIHHLDAPDGHLSEHRAEAAEAVRLILERLAPDDVVVTSSFDRHTDHRNAALAVHDAVNALSGARPRILEAPVWSLHHGPAIVSPWHLRRPIAVSTSGFLSAKRAALAEHRSQVSSLSGEDDWSHLDDRQIARHMGARELFIPVGPLRPDR